MSSYNADQHNSRMSVSRVEIVETDDSGPLQRATVKGLADEEIKMAYRVQPHGFSSNPPVGASGLLLQVGGRRDQAVLLGIEHQDHRPKGLAPGEKAIYDHRGQIIKMVGGNIIHETTGTVHIKADKIILEAAEVHLGAEGGKQVHRKDDIDTSGDAAVTHATKVWAV